MKLLSENPQLRKNAPVARGVLDYFPLAIVAVAECSLRATEQHHPGQPMHWSRDKSMDHADCIVRHLIERGTLDTDGVRHSAKVAWRALALLQIELETAAASVEDPLDAFERSWTGGATAREVEEDGATAVRDLQTGHVVFRLEK